MEHTKGPWKILEVNLGNQGGHKKYITGEIAGVPVDICQMVFTSVITKEEREANARLIASAPELLEALKYMILTWKGLAKKGTIGERAIKMSNEAISKTEGK